MGVEEKLPDGLQVWVGKLANWGRQGAIYPLTTGIACCAIEMMSASMARFDISRFGSEAFRATPRQSDLLIVSGRVSKKMAPVLQRLYEQMPDPKWVIAMGDCASSGGLFNNYAIVQGVDKFLPVDLYIPGCPPRPEMLLEALQTLKMKIMHEADINGKF